MGNKTQFAIRVKPARDAKEKAINFNKALKKWKNKYQEFGIREELVSRKEFVKPSLKKRIQRNETIRQNKRDELKRKENE